MEDSSYSLPEMEEQFKYHIGDVDSIEEITPYHHGILTNFYEMEDMYVRLIDWEIDDDGIPDSENELRGRVTENWTIAPFFEHLKQNEFGY